MGQVVIQVPCTNGISRRCSGIRIIPGNGTNGCMDGAIEATHPTTTTSIAGSTTVFFLIGDHERAH